MPSYSVRLLDNPSDPDAGGSIGLRAGGTSAAEAWATLKGAVAAKHAAGQPLTAAEDRVRVAPDDHTAPQSGVVIIAIHE